MYNQINNELMRIISDQGYFHVGINEIDMTHSKKLCNITIQKFLPQFDYNVRRDTYINIPFIWVMGWIANGTFSQKLDSDRKLLIFEEKAIEQRQKNSLENVDLKLKQESMQMEINSLQEQVSIVHEMVLEPEKVTPIKKTVKSN